MFLNAVLRGRDPTAVAVLLEDSAAVSGVILAATCLGLAHFTGNPVYDALGSIGIGGKNCNLFTKCHEVELVVDYLHWLNIA